MKLESALVEVGTSHGLISLIVIDEREIGGRPILRGVKLLFLTTSSFLAVLSKF